MAKKQKLSRHKFAGRNNGPARERYWRLGKLEEHKVRNLVRYNGMSVLEAKRFWFEVRKTRMK